VSTSRSRHPLNVSYLVVGLVFLGIAASWALHTADVVDTQQVGWLLPLVLVLAGGVGLAAGAAGAARGVHRAPRDDEPDPPYSA
jgi:hypothetical protein